MVTDEMDSGVETSSLNGTESPLVETAGGATIVEDIGVDETMENLLNADVPASLSSLNTPAADETLDITSGSFGQEPPRAILSSVEEADDDLDDFDETLAERLFGLTEMFPETLRNGVYSLCHNTISGVKWFYGFSRSATWILFSSSVVLLAAPTIEIERAQMQKQMQRQLLLGPGAVGGGGVGGPGMIGMAPSPPPPSKSQDL